MPIDLRRKIEEDTALIEAGDETYRGLAKRYNVKEGDVYRIHQEKLQKMKVEDAKDKLEVLEEEIRERREKKAGLEEEIKRLQQQKTQVEEGFKSQGLSWSQGVRLVVEISNLRDEKARLQKELPRLRATVKDWRVREKKTMHSCNDVLAKKRNLEGAFYNLERRFYSLLEDHDRYTAQFRAEVEKMERHKASMSSSIKKLEEQNTQLEELNSTLKGDTEFLKKEWQQLNIDVKREEEKKAKIKEECEKLVEEASERAKMIVEDAEQKKRKALEEVEEARKEKQKLEAEKTFLDTVVSMKIEELKEARNRLGMEATGHVTKEDAVPLEVLSSLPKIPPLRKPKKKAKIASPKGRTEREQA